MARDGVKQEAGSVEFEEDRKKRKKKRWWFCCDTVQYHADSRALVDQGRVMTTTFASLI